MNLKTNKMKLLKITKNGSLHFKLNDGRIGVTYESGYVRVCTRGVNYNNGRILMYQINKKISVPNKLNPKWNNYKRELIPNHIERIQHLLDFNAKNCG
mgnify:FL=1